jgi:hypothetical protein
MRRRLLARLPTLLVGVTAYAAAAPAARPSRLDGGLTDCASTPVRASTITKYSQSLAVGSLGGRTVEVAPTDTMRLQ